MSVVDTDTTPVSESLRYQKVVATGTELREAEHLFHACFVRCAIMTVTHYPFQPNR
jgi:hypothetical protein